MKFIDDIFSMKDLCILGIIILKGFIPFKTITLIRRNKYNVNNNQINNFKILNVFFSLFYLIFKLVIINMLIILNKKIKLYPQYKLYIS